MLQLLMFWNAPIFDLRTFSFNIRFATDINVGRKMRYHLCLYYGKDGFRKKLYTLVYEKGQYLYRYNQR